MSPVERPDDFERRRRRLEAMSDEELQGQTRLYGRDVANWAVLFQLVTHMNEHLGQSIAYARSIGVVPPWSQPAATEEGT